MQTYNLATRRTTQLATRLPDVLNRKLTASIYQQVVFKCATLFRWMRLNGIPIPIDPKTGQRSCASKLIKTMIDAWPKLGEFYEYRRMIDALKNLGRLEIGADGRNR